MGIGKRIKEARVKSGLTQEELARIIGVTKGAIANYELETSHPKEPVMYALIDALGVEPNFLFQDCVSLPRKEKASLYSSEAMDLARDYDGLDVHGKHLVRLVVNEEKNRCTSGFPYRLREAMGEMSVEDFVQKLGMTYKVQGLLQYLSGERKPKAKALHDLAKCLEVSPNWLCGLDEAKEPIPALEDGLDDIEKLLMQAVHDLAPGQQQMFLEQLQAMIASQKETLPSSAQE